MATNVRPCGGNFVDLPSGRVTVTDRQELIKGNSVTPLSGSRGNLTAGNLTFYT
jgi:hypothetical protein